METKKIKVLSVEHSREFTTNSGFKIQYFKLMDDHEDVYEFSSNVRDQKKFVIGNTYEVTVEKKQTSRGEYFFIDLSQSEKERKKISTGGYSGRKSFYRTRRELMSIISQSSYEAATFLCVKFAPSVIESHKDISKIAKVLSTFIIEKSELDSDLCKKENPDALKVANEKSIVLQKSLKIAIEALNLPKLTLDDKTEIKGTQAVISLTELIAEDINSIANEL